MMYKLTTPNFNLSIPYTQTEIQSVEIILNQQSRNVLRFYLQANEFNSSSQISVQDNLISFQLTQEESNLFVLRYPIHLQVRVLLTNGQVKASKIVHINVHRELGKDILE